MKYLFVLISFISLTFISNAQTIIPAGDVSGVWTIGGSPYQIEGDITIPSLEILTIEPGVMVEFQGHYKLNVQGRLFAIGTENDTITFTINDTTGFYNPEIPDGGWAGIRFINVFSLIDSSSIVYCKLEYGKALGYWPDGSGGAICVDGFDKLTIANCMITNNIASITDGSGGGIALWNSNPEIRGNTISNNVALFGGGIQCYESSPLIQNNIIEYNAADAGGGVVCNGNSNPTIINSTIGNNSATSGNGGAIACWESSPNLVNVIINGNTAFWGGGIDCYSSNLNLFKVNIEENNANSAGGIFASDSDVQMDSCNFIGNEALNNSGGCIRATKCNLQIDACSFNGNDAYSGGGAIAFDADTSYTGLPYQVTITNTDFLENTAYSRAGVFINNWGSTPLIIDVTINNCEFSNNVSDHYTGLNAYNSSISVSNCVFSGNSAVSYTSAAGFSSGCIGTISNCLFTSNIANTGGGNWNSGGLTIWGGSNVDVMNCTFADNTAGYGAGLTVGYGGTATTTNCIFWGNSIDQIALDTYDNIGGTLSVYYCDIEGGENSVNVVDPSLSTLNWGIGNRDEEPIFEDSGDGNYHLQNSSPCIGAGITAIQIGGVWHFCPNDDIEGNPRPNPSGSMPDIGAYESPLANPVGVEENGVVHPIEYVLFQNYPNPFNSSTKINYSVPEQSKVKIIVFDILGNEIETLVNAEKPVGTYELTWNARNLPSGVYFYRFRAGSFIETKKMLMIK